VNQSLVETDGASSDSSLTDLGPWFKACLAIRGQGVECACDRAAGLTLGVSLLFIVDAVRRASKIKQESGI
jgi:hypothetical protein